MSAISNVGTSSSTTQSTNAFGALGSDEFMKIIFTELQSQDPLEPSDTSTLLQQLSTIRSIESDMNLTTQLESFVQQNEVTSASSLVGKFVAAKGQYGTDEVGYVDSVLLTSAGPMLNLSNGAQVAFDRLTEIIDPNIIGSAPPDETGDADPDPADIADDPEPADEVEPEDEEKKDEQNEGGA